MLWRVRWWRVPLPEILFGILTGFGVGYSTGAELILNWFVLIPSFVLSLVLNFAPVRSFITDALFIIFGVGIIAGTLYYFRDVDGPVFLPGIYIFVGQWFLTAGACTALRRLGAKLSLNSKMRYAKC